jgi:hypothetical protein
VRRIAPIFAPAVGGDSQLIPGYEAIQADPRDEAIRADPSDEVIRDSGDEAIPTRILATRRFVKVVNELSQTDKPRIEILHPDQATTVDCVKNILYEKRLYYAETQENWTHKPIV